MVFQAFNLFPHLTVLDNCVLAPVRVHGVPRPEAVARAPSSCPGSASATTSPSTPTGSPAASSSASRWSAPCAPSPSCCSSTRSPQPSTRSWSATCSTIVRDLAEAGTTMVLATHEMSFAREVATSVCFLDDGRILEQGPPAQLLVAPRAGAHPAVPAPRPSPVRVSKPACSGTTYIRRVRPRPALLLGALVLTALPVLAAGARACGGRRLLRRHRGRLPGRRGARSLDPGGRPPSHDGDTIRVGARELHRGPAVRLRPGVTLQGSGAGTGDVRDRARPARDAQPARRTVTGRWPDRDVRILMTGGTGSDGDIGLDAERRLAWSRTWS